MKNKILIIAVILLSVNSLFSQTLYNSPYSRYGIGQINSSNNAFQLGQGGLSYTTALPNIVNMSNVASLSYLRRHTPVFDISLTSDLVELKTTSSSENYRNTNISNFTLGLPISKRSGLAFSYQPYTKMGYRVTDSLVDPSGIDYANYYVGQGGLNKFTMGLSHVVYRADSADFKISIGANANYIYGNFNNVRISDFPTNSGFNSLLVKDSVSVKDVAFDGGLLIKYNPEGKWKYVFGATYSLTSNLNAKNEFVAFTYNGSTTGIIDTVKHIPSKSGVITVPSALGFALESVYNNKLGIGAQITLRDWSKFSYEFANHPNTLYVNSQEYNLGIWYKPSGLKGNTNGGSFKNATYKTGFRMSSIGLNLNNTNIQEMAVSAGVHLPLVNSGTFSSVNLGTEFGMRGTTDNGLLQENFVKVKLGFSITPSVNDRWFIKRKYD